MLTNFALNLLLCGVFARQLSEQVRLFDACDDPHCNPTCLGEFLTAGREGTESKLAWTLVLATLGLALSILGAGKKQNGRLVQYILSFTLSEFVPTVFGTNLLGITVVWHT